MYACEKRTTLFMAAMVLSIALARPGIAISVGEEAPAFRVTSGTGDALTSDMTKGKVAVVFYETKDTIETNRALKTELNAFYAAKPEAIQRGIVRVAIVRCSSFMPIVWRRSLRDHSKRENMIIYGDWDGSMERSYGMKAGESNFLIIDRMGVVRYAAAGGVPDREYDAIKQMLDSLI